MTVETCHMPHLFWPGLCLKHTDLQLSQLSPAFALAFGRQSFDELCFFMPRWNAADMPLLVIREWGGLLSVDDSRAWIISVLSLFWGKDDEEVSQAFSYSEIVSGVGIGRILSEEGAPTSRFGLPLLRERESFFVDAVCAPPIPDTDFVIYLYREMICDWFSRYLRLECKDDFARIAINYLEHSRQNHALSGRLCRKSSLSSRRYRN